MATEFDREMMLLALAEARRGDTSPNPHVGAIVVRDGRVLSVGHHRRAGLPHAEIEAIGACTESTEGATLYCTLEPCNHHGRTPPCSDAVIEAGFARVVLGCRDPLPHVGGAVEKLRAAGIEVEVGVEEDSARELVSDFLRHLRDGLPFAILKAAITLDGKIATQSGDSKWITGEPARRKVHAMRAYADAVLVGVSTVIADDPSLTVRLVEGRHPKRIVLDTHLRTPPDSKLVRDQIAPTIILHGPNAAPERRRALKGVEFVECDLDSGGRVDAAQALAELARRDVMRLLVEGGARVHGALLSAALYQRAAIFVAPKILGDPKAPSFLDRGDVGRIADALELAEVRVGMVGDDILIEGAFDSAGPGPSAAL